MNHFLCQTVPPSQLPSGVQTYSFPRIVKSQVRKCHFWQILPPVWKYPPHIAQASNQGVQTVSSKLPNRPLDLCCSPTLLSAIYQLQCSAMPDVGSTLALADFA